MIVRLSFLVFWGLFCIQEKASVQAKTEEKVNAVPLEQIKLFADSQLNIGCTLPLTKGVGLVGADLEVGINLVFNKVNREGGIKKKTLLKLVVVDDHYQAALACTNILNLYGKTRLSLAAFGPDTLAALKDEVAQKHLAILFPASGGSLFRDQKDAGAEQVIFYRAPLALEVATLLNYAVCKMQKKKIAVFYEDSSFGEEGLRHTKQTIQTLVNQEAEVKIVAESSYPKNTLRIMAAVKEIASHGPDAIICIAHSYPAYNFIQLVVNEGLATCLFLGLGELAPIQSILARSRGIKLILSSCVPNPYAESEIAKQYQQAMKKDFPIKELSTFGFEGYIYGQLLVETLEKLSPDATIKDLFAGLRAVDNNNWRGLALKYDPQICGLLNTVWINEEAQSKTPWLSDKELLATTKTPMRKALNKGVLP